MHPHSVCSPFSPRLATTSIKGNHCSRWATVHSSVFQYHLLGFDLLIQMLKCKVNLAMSAIYTTIRSIRHVIWPKCRRFDYDDRNLDASAQSFYYASTISQSPRPRWLHPAVQAIAPDPLPLGSVDSTHSFTRMYGGYRADAVPQIAGDGRRGQIVRSGCKTTTAVWYHCLPTQAPCPYLYPFHSLKSMCLIYSGERRWKCWAVTAEAFIMGPWECKDREPSPYHPTSINLDQRILYCPSSHVSPFAWSPLIPDIFPGIPFQAYHSRHFQSNSNVFANVLMGLPAVFTEWVPRRKCLTICEAH